MAPVGLKHWMLHNGQLAKEYDETLKLSPGYDPVRAVDPALTFHAPLLTGPDSIPGAIRATFDRNSEATYLAPRGAFLLTAGDDVSRHEYTRDDEPLGVLMEPASTNKCENYNANPDEALTNVNITGGPGILTREKADAPLAAVGLSKVCHSGFVFCLDTRGVAITDASVQGDAGNLNLHQYSAFIYCPQGSGLIAIEASGASTSFGQNTGFEKIQGEGIPSTTARRFMVRADADSLVYFILNKLEELSTPSSDIVTEGSAVSRAVDRLSYPMAGGPYSPQIVDDSQFNDSDAWTKTAQVTIANGLCTFDTTIANEHVYDEDYPEIRRGNWYRIRIEVPRMPAGRFQVRLYDEQSDYSSTDWVSEAGVHEFLIQLTGADGAGSFVGAVFIISDLAINDFDIASIQIFEAQPILNQTEGMLSIIFRPSFDNAQYPSVAPNNLHIVRFDDNNSIPIYYNKESGGTDRFGSWDNATIAEVDIPGGIDADVDYLVTLHWAPGARQLAFKRAGTWTRGTVFGFAGAWPIQQSMQVISMLSSGNEAQLPAHARELYIWNVNRGQAWLEDFFADLVN